MGICFPTAYCSMYECYQKQILEGKNDKWKNLEAEASLNIEELILKKSLQMVTAAMKLKDTCSLEEKLWPT